LKSDRAYLRDFAGGGIEFRLLDAAGISFWGLVRTAKRERQLKVPVAGTVDFGTVDFSPFAWTEH
jgi:hypothetical protein